jgi:hypothetical protein
LRNTEDGGEAILEAFRALKVDYVISSLTEALRANAAGKSAIINMIMPAKVR